MLKKLTWICALSLISSAVCNETSTVFERVYDEGAWGWIYDEQQGKFRGGSGEGSDPQNALPYLGFLQNFLRENDINSVVDVGSGDWRLSNKIDWSGIEYLGVDVVPFLIDYNNRVFGASNIHFELADGVREDLPAADLLICKDVLQHLPIEDVQSFFKQLHKYKYALLTNDVNPDTLKSDNRNIVAGEYRPIALTETPFNLRAETVLCYRCVGGEVKLVLLWKNDAVSLD
ncbi:MAG: class I SAM-dependent methyltransferase [Rhabdochlamydiaceae bacterium]|nr:class I SAM-dependent methyltransferase [Rhabdochlamydiaceae bacterium]